MTKHGLLFIGVDPGKTGAIAAITGTGKAAHVLRLGKLTESDICNGLVDLWRDADGGFAFLEFVRSSPQMGVASAFTFGQSLGFLRGSLISAGIPFEEVTPSKWQGALKCRSGGDKNITKAKAQQLFPDIKITHAIADALLIAEYGRRLRAGELS